MSGSRRTTRLRLSDACQALLLTVAATVVWFFAILFFGGIVEEVLRKTDDAVSENHSLTYQHDGFPIWITTRYRHGIIELTECRDLDGKPVGMKPEEANAHQHALIDARIFRQPKRHHWMEDSRHLNFENRQVSFFERTGDRGHFVIFHATTRRRIGFIGPEGFSEHPLPAEKQYLVRERGDQAAVMPGFATAIFYGARLTDFPTGSQNLWFVREPGGRRVHLVDLEQRTSRVAHDGEPVLAMCFDWQRDIGQKSLPLESPRIVLRTETALKVVEPAEAGAVRLVEEIRFPSRLHHAAQLNWIRTPDGPLFDLLLDDDRHQLIWANAAGEVIRERTIESRSPNLDGRAFWMLPLLQSPLVADVLARVMVNEDELNSDGIDRAKAQALGLIFARGKRLPIRDAVMPLALLHLSTLLWSALAVRRLRRFGASTGEQVFWGGWILIGGFPGYLAFRVHRDWHVGRALLPVVTEQTGKSAHPTAAAAAAAAAAARESSRDGVKRLLVRCSETAVLVADASAVFVYGVMLRIGLTPGHAALVMKEVRVSLGLVVAASIGFVFVVGKLTVSSGFGFMSQFFGIFESTMPFFQMPPFGNLSLLFAVSLAVMQVMSESRHEAWLFSLHRPISRRAIVIIKLAVGLVLLLVTTAVPIVMYSLWAARPGTHPSPFEWGMTEAAWRHWWCVPPVYLGTLLMMLRPARWLGTRVLPCAAGLWWFLRREAWGLSLWPIGWEFSVLLAIDAVFVICLLLVIREREYP